MQEIEKNTAALRLNVPELFERSTETDYKKRMKKIGKYVGFFSAQCNVGVKMCSLAL